MLTTIMVSVRNAPSSPVRWSMPITSTFRRRAFCPTDSSPVGQSRRRGANRRRNRRRQRQIAGRGVSVGGAVVGVAVGWLSRTLVKVALATDTPLSARSYCTWRAKPYEPTAHMVVAAMRNSATNTSIQPGRRMNTNPSLPDKCGRHYSGRGLRVESRACSYAGRAQPACALLGFPIQASYCRPAGH